MLDFIYTSAPETLDGPGYGAVAKSERFPADLEKFVRKLCRYDFLSNGFDPGEADYPDVYSHAIFRQGAEQWHVFSRVGFAGHDYTDRSVFLAHHIALTATEMNQIRVTDLLRQPDLFRTAWSEPPHTLAPRALPRTRSSRSGAKQWTQATGDGEWSRVWAQKWHATRNEPRFLVVPNDVETFTLFLESLDTLPAEQAGQTTFLTHLASDHRGPTYEWIGLLANSDLASSIERHSKDRVLNLARPLGSPEDLLEEIDREAALQEERAQRAAAAARPIPKAAAAAPVVEEVDDDIPEEYRVQQPAGATSQASQPSSKTRRRPADSLPELPTSRLADSNTKSIYLAIAGIVAVLAIGIIVWAIRPAPEVRKPTTNIGGDDDEETPENEVPAQVAGGAAATSNGGAPASQGAASGGAPPGKSVALAPPKPIAAPVQRVAPTPVVKFVQQGLRESLTKVMGTGRGKLLEIGDSDELNRAGIAARLINDPKLGLSVSSSRVNPDGTPNSAGPLLDLHVKYEDDPNKSVHLQVGQGAVWFNVGAVQIDTVSQDVLDRLRFSILEIESSPEDDRPFLFRVTLTPKLSAVPLNGLNLMDTSFKIEESKKRDVNDLLLAIDRWQSMPDTNPLDCYLRIEGITLSILPGSNAGWSLGDIKMTKFKAPLGPKELKLSNGGTNIAGTFNLETSFDRDNDSSKPVIAAEFVIPDPPGAAPAASVDAANSEGSTEAGKAETKETKTPAPKSSTAKPKKKTETKDDDRLGGTGTEKEKEAKETKKVTPPRDDNAIAVERLPQLPDYLLMKELFRRYGRVRADLVVKVPRRGEAATASAVKVSPKHGDRAVLPVAEPLKQLEGKQIKPDVGGAGIDAGKIKELTKDAEPAEEGPQEIVILRFGE